MYTTSEIPFYSEIKDFFDQTGIKNYGVTCDPSFIHLVIAQLLSEEKHLAIVTACNWKDQHWNTVGMKQMGFNVTEWHSPFPNDVNDYICVAAALIRAGIQLSKSEIDLYTELTRQRLAIKKPTPTNSPISGHNMGIISHGDGITVLGDQCGTVSLTNTELVSMATFSARYKNNQLNVYSR